MVSDSPASVCIDVSKSLLGLLLMLGVGSMAVRPAPANKGFIAW